MQPTAVPGVELLRAHFVEHSFDRHSHDTWSIGVTLAGQQSFRCRGTTTTSRSGNVIVFRPDDAHDGHGEDEDGFRYAMLYLCESVVSAWLREASTNAVPCGIRDALIDDEALGRCIADAVQACLQPGESLRSATLMQHAVLRLFQRHAGHPVTTWRETGTPRWLHAVRDHLEAHYASDVTVEQLARIAGVSRVHLTRAFMKAFGQPPHGHLNSLRLRAAKRLLARGQSIAETAADAGFADQSHLTRRFKATFGVTPGAWLRQTHPRNPA
jgi:AraC-like DNA-binding protein